MVGVPVPASGLTTRRNSRGPVHRLSESRGGNGNGVPCLGLGEAAITAVLVREDKRVAHNAVLTVVTGT